jgi:hypothetical protein
LTPTIFQSRISAWRMSATPPPEMTSISIHHIRSSS